MGEEVQKQYFDNIVAGAAVRDSTGQVISLTLGQQSQNIAQLTLGLAQTNSNVSLLSIETASKVPKSLTSLPEVQPKQSTIQQQSEMVLYIDNNGVPSKVRASELDYSKLTVIKSSEEDLSKIKDNDFLFSTED